MRVVVIVDFSSYTKTYIGCTLFSDELLKSEQCVINIFHCTLPYLILSDMKRFYDKRVVTCSWDSCLETCPCSWGNHRLRENRWFTCQITSLWSAELSSVTFFNFFRIHYENEKDNNLILDFFKCVYWLTCRTTLINFTYPRRTFILYTIILYNVSTINFVVFI